MSTKETRNEDMKEYRKFIIESSQKCGESYDKTIITLSGGALGISLTFVNNFLSNNPSKCVAFLVIAWICWAASLVFTMMSLFFNQYAFEKVISQIDEGVIDEVKHPGGIWYYLVKIFTGFGAFFFVIGVVSLIIFTKSNILQ